MNPPCHLENIRACSSSSSQLFKYVSSRRSDTCTQIFFLTLYWSEKVQQNTLLRSFLKFSDCILHKINLKKANNLKISIRRLESTPFEVFAPILQNCTKNKNWEYYLNSSKINKETREITRFSFNLTMKNH